MSQYDTSPEANARRAAIDSMVAQRLTGTVQEVYDSLDSAGQARMYDLMDIHISASTRNAGDPDAAYDDMVCEVSAMGAIDFINSITLNDMDTIIFLLQQDCGNVYDKRH